MVGGGLWALRHRHLLPQLAINRPTTGDVRVGIVHVLLAAAAFLLVAALVWHVRRRRGQVAGALDVMAEVGTILTPLLGLPFVALLELPGIERDRPALTLSFITAVAALWAV